MESNRQTLSSSCLSTGVHLLALFNNVTMPTRQKIFTFWLCNFQMGLGVKNLNCKWHPTVQTHDDLMVVGFLCLKLQYFYYVCLFCHKMPNPTQLLFCNTWVDIAVPVLGHLNVYLILVKHPEIRNAKLFPKYLKWRAPSTPGSILARSSSFVEVPIKWVLKLVAGSKDKIAAK